MLIPLKYEIWFSIILKCLELFMEPTRTKLIPYPIPSYYLLSPFPLPCFKTTHDQHYWYCRRPWAAVMTYYHVTRMLVYFPFLFFYEKKEQTKKIENNFKNHLQKFYSKNNIPYPIKHLFALEKLHPRPLIFFLYSKLVSH